MHKQQCMCFADLQSLEEKNQHDSNANATWRLGGSWFRTKLTN